MGNNNSASLAQMGPHSQWSGPEPHSDPRMGMDDGRNRMRKGYNPHKKYMGHLVPPQKVLPAVNPTKAAKKLKPTSNGMNLKQCGTISGRKLNEIELDLSSRTSNVDMVDGFRSGGEQRRDSRMKGSDIPGLVRQNGMSSPNLLEEVDRMRGGFEPLQNSKLNRANGKGFHESEPELRQPPQRSTALGFPSHLPLPPQPVSHIQESAAKKQIRSKKKKTAPPPPLVASKKSNSFLQHTPKPTPTPPLVHEITKVHQRMFKTKAEGRLSSSSVETKQLNGRPPPQSGSSTRTDSRNSSTSTSVTPGKENGVNRPTAVPTRQEMRRDKSPDYTPTPSRELNGQMHRKPRGQQVKPPLETVMVQKHYIPYSSGIDEPSSEFKGNQTGIKKPSGINGAENLKGKGSNNVQEKKSFYFGMDREDFEPKPSDHRRNLPEVEKNIIPYVQTRGVRQGANYKEDPREESLSDNASTSSEMDIVLRPTLPPKRTQLPKFSPSAAWNRIDLDSPNSSEEEALRFNPRKEPTGGVTAAGVKEPNAGEGDSGISGLDGDGGGSPEILPILPVQPLTSGSKAKCWTPEQDLDESSSEFEAEEEGIRQGRHKDQVKLQGSQGPSDRARLTTRRNFFTNSKSDTEGTTIKVDEPIYARSTKSRGGHSLSVTDKGDDDDPLTMSPPENTHPLEFKPSLNRIINYRRTLNKEVAGVGLDANWFLSRSEPNSLNLTHLMIGGGGEPGRRGGRDDDEVGIRSENGYAPTKLNYENVDEPPESLNWNKSASLISLSHIVYLPQSHASMDEVTGGGGGKRNRRAKSVENLLNSNDRKNNRTQYDNGKIQSPHQLPPHRQPANYNKRKKFKFQSTLKVLERKQIERELSREAEEKELERLREIEAMKRVEAEFQKKRKHREAEKEAAVPSGGVILNAHSPAVVVTLRQWEDEEQIPRPASQLRSSACSTPCQFSNKSSVSTRSSNLSKVQLTQRQDPEGAPSIQDLRKELIIGAKKRNGISSASSDLTQELSEYRQETRQYCDYRSSPRLNMDLASKSRTKFVDSTSSDIYPVTGRTQLMDKHRPGPKSTVVYPEIVCDIPNKPFPYMVNFSSRLSGSHTSLLIEERPPSGVGYTSGPSSVISDNYRRDWAHHHGNPSGSSIGNAGKSSSITSLHSTSDIPRQVLQLDGNESSIIDSPKIFHRVLGSRGSEIKESENGRHSMNVVNESLIQKRGPSQMASDACLQPQSFISYKTKSYRPVIFNPATTTSRP